MNKITLFNEIESHILDDDKPSEYLNDILKKGILSEYPFNILSDLNDVEQNKEYHPEGSVWNHTMMVVDQAARVKDRSEDKRVFMWAALLHDIGKKTATKIRNGRVTAYNHEKIGKDMVIEFFSMFSKDKDFVDKVSGLVRWHMEPLFAAKNLPFSNIEKMLAEVSLHEIALLSICDRLGRGDMSEKKKEDEEKGIEMFVEKCKLIQKQMNRQQQKNEY